MPARPRRRAQRPKLPPSGVLDWSDRAHWSGRELPCRYCAGLTHLRDSGRKPAHKTCAEDALRQQVVDAAAAYENERLP